MIVINSNIHSINLLESIVNEFNKGYDTEQEIGLFYNVVPNLDKSSINDNNMYYLREEDPELELDTELVVPAKEIETIENSLFYSILLEDIQKIQVKHLKEQLTAHGLSSTRVKAILVDCLTIILNDNILNTDSSECLTRD